MKKLILLFICVFCFNASFSQITPLYTVGGGSDQLRTINTNYDVINSQTLTGSLSVNSGYGLTYDAINNIYYILYGSTDGEVTTRRLGTVDLTTAIITDIASVGILTDLMFYDGVLYGTTGTLYETYTFVEINTTDGSVTNLFDHTSSMYGQSIVYDSFNNEILKFDVANVSLINATTLTSDSIIGTGISPAPLSGGVAKNDSTIILASGVNFYEFNTNTYAFVLADSIEFGMHAIVYGNDIICSEIIEASATTTDELFGTDATIDVTITGGTAPYTFDWDNDETGDFDDLEDLTDIVAGTYTLIVTDEFGCKDSLMVTVNSQLNVEALSSDLIAIYPNPTTDQFIIDFEGKFTYSLSTINGDVLLNGTASNKQLVSLDAFAKGIYFIAIKSENFTTIVKVIKK